MVAKKGEEREKLPGVYGSPDRKAPFALALRVAEMIERETVLDGT